jgi:hypothetical protein
MIAAEQIIDLFQNTFIICLAVFQSIFCLIEKYKLDEPILKIILGFVPALLSISYPLIIQSISRLNDQYNSTHIIEQFKKESRHIFFIWNLRISVLLTIICFFLSVEFYLLAFLSVVSLLISFFFYLQLLLSYQNGKDLFKLYSDKLKIDSLFNPNSKSKLIKKRKKLLMQYWYPIIDLSLYAIKNIDRKLENDIRVFYIYKVFSFYKHVEQKDIENIQFPPELYNSAFDIIYTYIKINERDYCQNIEVFIGSIYFTQSYSNSHPQYFHQDTIHAIWRNIVLLIENERSDKIIQFWQSSHQYFEFNLKIPVTDYDENYNETESSIEQRNKVIKYREAFIQLHTAIGAYLYYKRALNTVREIWFFTQSQPPVYVLLPQYPDDIFYYFFKFLDHESFNDDMVIQFRFKDLDFDRMNNERDVKFVVCEYIGLLFLRLYITAGFYGPRPISTFPQIPIDQSEKKRWENKLDVFKNIIETHLGDKVLMDSLGLSKITRENCKKSNLLFPLDYIDELKVKVQTGFEKVIIESELDPEKTKKLDENTINSIRSVYKDISRIKGSEVNKENRDVLSNTMETVRGTRLLLEKEAFIADPSFTHLNADSIVGEIIKNEYYHHFVSKISFQNIKYSYHVPNGQMFLAVKKLNPSPQKFIILSFGVNIEYLRDYKNVQIEKPTGDEDFRFMSIPIYCYNTRTYGFHNTIYLVSVDDLPMVKHTDWSEIEDLSESTKDRWRKMELIDEELKIYREFKDLNRDESLQNEYIKQGKNKEELKNMIEVDVDFIGYIWFRKDVQLIKIKEGELFQEGGENDMDNIEPLE